MMIDLKKYSQLAHTAAIQKGWWDYPVSTPTCLMLVISELSKAIEADRKGKQANVVYFKHRLAEIEGSLNGEDKTGVFNMSFARLFRSQIKDSVQDELADTCIRILDLIGYGIDFAENDIFYREDLTGLTLPDVLFIVAQSVSASRLQEALGYLFIYANSQGIDLKWHIDTKMKYNALRPYKHGKLY